MDERHSSWQPLVQRCIHVPSVEACLAVFYLLLGEWLIVELALVL